MNSGIVELGFIVGLMNDGFDAYIFEGDVRFQWKPLIDCGDKTLRVEESPDQVKSEHFSDLPAFHKLHFIF